MSEKRSAISYGEVADEVMAQSKQVQVKLRDFVSHMILVIKREKLEAEEIKQLYQAITNRMISKICQKCGKLKLEIEGAVVWVDGDMSKPKKFVCKECK